MLKNLYINALDLDKCWLVDNSRFMIVFLIISLSYPIKLLGINKSN